MGERDRKCPALFWSTPYETETLLKFRCVVVDL